MAATRHSAFCTLHSAFCTRRRRSAAGLSLVEILIALFVFLIGILGVLSLFPVAMNSAGRAIGEVRSNILAQSALAQLTADCKAVYCQGTVGGATPNTLTDTSASAWAADWTGYYVTIRNTTTSGTPAASQWQSRLIIASTPGVPNMLTVCPDWNPRPNPNDMFIITRMGLPSPLRGTVSAASGSTLDMLNVTVIDNEWNGCYVQILDAKTPLIGNAKGEIRRIVGTTAATSSLTLDYPWDATTSPPRVPQTGDSFVITTSSPRTLFPGIVASAVQSGPPSLTAAGASWAVDNQWNGYYVEIRSGVASGLLRRIATTTAATSTLTLDQDWPAARVPAAGDSFGIINGAMRTGVVRAMVPGDPSSFYAGASDGDTDPNVNPLTWQIPAPPALASTGIAWAPNPALTQYTCVNPSTLNTFDQTGAGSTASAGQLVVILGDPRTRPAAGQVRLITSSGSGAVSVFPDWNAGTIPQTGDRYEIRERLGYFLVITTGRAAGKVLPIIAYTPDTTDPPGTGDRITCGDWSTSAGANFSQLGVTPAWNGAASIPPYPLRNATGFMIIGNKSVMTTAIPLGDVRPGGPPWLPAPCNRINTFGLAKTAEPQTGADVWFSSATPPDGAYTSEYSYVAIFGDCGGFPDGPVQVDVFVYRNFDSAKNLNDNQKPVGFITGYVGRP